MTLRRINAASLTCLLLAALGLGLGIWQWQRSLYKLTLVEKRAQTHATVLALGRDEDARWNGQMAAQDWDQRPVSLNGVWMGDRQVYLDNRAHDGLAGVHVLAPMALPDGSVAWVNRGWAPKMPGTAVGQGAEVFVTGQAYRPPEGPQTLLAVGQASLMRRIELTQDPSILRQGALWQNFDDDAARQWLQRSQPHSPPVWPVIFWQTNDAADGLTRSLPKLSNDAVAVHRGYALQWWLLTIVALFFAWRLSKKDPS